MEPIIRRRVGVDEILLGDGEGCSLDLEMYERVPGKGITQLSETSAKLTIQHVRFYHVTVGCNTSINVALITDVSSVSFLFCPTTVWIGVWRFFTSSRS